MCSSSLLILRPKRINLNHCPRLAVFFNLRKTCLGLVITSSLTIINYFVGFGRFVTCHYRCAYVFLSIKNSLTYNFKTVQHSIVVLSTQIYIHNLPINFFTQNYNILVSSRYLPFQFHTKALFHPPPSLPSSLPPHKHFLHM